MRRPVYQVNALSQRSPGGGAKLRPAKKNVGGKRSFGEENKRRDPPLGLSCASSLSSKPLSSEANMHPPRGRGGKQLQRERQRIGLQRTMAGQQRTLAGGEQHSFLNALGRQKIGLSFLSRRSCAFFSARKGFQAASSLAERSAVFFCARRGFQAASSLSERSCPSG